MTLLKKYTSQQWRDFGIYALYLTCFSCLLSSSLTAIFSAVMLFCWLAAGAYRDLPAIFRENPVTIIGLVLCSLLFVGVFYSPAPLVDSLAFFKKYRLLLFIPIVMSLTRGRDVQRSIVNAFLLGYLVVLVNAYLVHFAIVEPNILSIKRSGGGFLVVFAYLVLQRALQRKPSRYFWAILFVILCYDIFFILNTRTGWLISIFLSLLFSVQYFSARKIGAVLLLVICLATTIYFTSQSVQQRIQLTIDNLKQYNPEKRNARTSLGLRLDWYQNSLDLIRKKPIFGYGTGSYETVQHELIKGTPTEPASDPHNEYLLTTVQLGLVGGGVLLLFLLAPVFRSFKLLSLNERDQAFALQATVLFLFIGCFLNSWLLSTMPSHIYLFLLAAFYPIRHCR